MCVLFIHLPSILSQEGSIAIFYTVCTPSLFYPINHSRVQFNYPNCLSFSVPLSISPFLSPWSLSNSHYYCTLLFSHYNLWGNMVCHTRNELPHVNTGVRSTWETMDFCRHLNGKSGNIAPNQSNWNRLVLEMWSHVNKYDAENCNRKKR